MSRVKFFLCTLLLATLVVSCSQDETFSEPLESYEDIKRPMDDINLVTSAVAVPSYEMIFEEYSPPIRLIDHPIYSVLDPILPDKFSSNDIGLLEQGFVWAYQEDGSVVYTIDFKYSVSSIIKLLVTADTEHNIKSINIIETFIGSTNNTVSLHHAMVDSIVIYTVDSESIKKGSAERNSFVDCKKIVFDNDPGSGTDTFDPGNSSTTVVSNDGTDHPGGDGTGGVIDTGDGYLIMIVCGCPPRHTGGKTNRKCNCSKGDVIIIVKKPATLKGNDAESQTRNDEDQDYWDCVEDLIGCQMLNDYDLAMRTLKHCHGVYDVNDVDNQSGNDGSNQFIGPVFCDDWFDYHQNCLNGGTSEEDVYQPWAGFMVDYPDLFFEVIEALPECTSTEEMEEKVCVEEAYFIFISEYGLNPLPEEEEAIKKNPCGDKFEDLATDLLMEKCLGAFYNVLVQIEDLTNTEKLGYCNSELPIISVDPPGCEGCSVGEAQVVWEDEIKALNMLDCAIEKLDAFDGSSPTDVSEALANHFGGTSSAIVANYIKFLFKHVRKYPYERGYQAQDQGEGLCGEFTDAWTIPTVHSANVRLCRPRYWLETNEVERAGTLIHEWMHLYYFAGDIAYDWSETYNDLTTIQQLFNADAFSEFVKEICND